MTLTDLQKRKLTRFFTVFDQDNDGLITRQDYILLAENVSRVKGFPPESPLSVRVKECLLQVWSNLEILADKDHDGHVTMEEFLDYRDKLHQDQVKFDDLVSAGLMLFDVMDGDHDGRLNVNEFADFYSFFQLDADLATQMFDRMDSDTTGYLTREQIRTYSRQFNLGDDHDDIGNWLFGPY